ncbi:MAG: ribosomal L7Ae/L30e/S12e/Gadd45 family protein [Nanoarchaeota archaeon]
MAKSKDIAEMYVEEITPSNEIKGFTKSFVKRTKDKRTENVNVKELLGYAKENKIIIGAKVTEKKFKQGDVKKIFTSKNCDKKALIKIGHYAKISKVDIVELDIDNSELAQKLGKPFLVSMICVVNK